MPAAAALRTQIEAVLLSRIPGALTPMPRLIQPVLPTGLSSVDEVLTGGLPVGAVTEITGPECSGRTSLALSFIAQMTAVGRVCAWVDVSNALHPESAAAAGVDLRRILWVRCGVASTPATPDPNKKKGRVSHTPSSRMDDSLRVTDLLLQGGGFSAIVLDMGGMVPQYALRVPLATWFRFRAAAERTQASILLLTQHPCAKSSAGLTLGLNAGEARTDEATLFTGIGHRLDVARQRTRPVAPPVVPPKPPQRETNTRWDSRAAWAGSR